MAGVAPAGSSQQNGSLSTIPTSGTNSSRVTALNEITPPDDLFNSITTTGGFVANFQSNMGDTVAQLEKAKKLYLETLAPGTLRSVIDARQLFVVWFTNAHPGRAVTFPLTEMDIKAFTISLCEAGFKYARIMNNIYKGLGMWQISNNHTSPGKMYPELGSTISKYLRRSIGANPLLPKEPMFKSNFEHILDVLGIDNDANLQRAIRLAELQHDKLPLELLYKC
ncbi:hypothetical protein OS493_014613 [Desmophyllum pertusum]|uniref:Uncharacterized protein n=1 Tax=Desmophyllum pertusum TaxID=174260 RepID=A0A9W9YQ68_9CNID|nr:hypothetical protein OS493_014613 [Desmophyllum pertusum]